MPFISDDQIEKSSKKIEIDKKIEKKTENNMINQTAKEKTQLENLEKPFSNKELLNIAKKSSSRGNSSQNRVTAKDLETELEIFDLLDKRKKEEIGEMLQDTEIQEIQKEFIGILALPMTHPDKRRIFHHKLNQSDTIHNYLNDNIMFRWFGKANSHFKFGTLYAMKYLQTHSEYAQYLHQLERERAQQQHTQPVETKTE
jgi:hypothetical protein